MLKLDGKFITPEYEKVCCGFIDDAIVKNTESKCSVSGIAQTKQ